MVATQKAGDMLRDWRLRRRLSQLDLACEADISTRHLSFLATGRAMPSREMVLHLAEHLDVPLRERNLMLTAAGYAAVYPERPLADPAMRMALDAVNLVLTGHEPFPALAVDRHWNLVAANKSLTPLLAGVDAALLEPPVNVMRLALHPGGIAPRVGNFAEWRAHLLTRLRRQLETTGDPLLAALHGEVAQYPFDIQANPKIEKYAGIVVPLQLLTDRGTLNLFSTTTVFGTPLDVTIAELAIESFFPADPETALALREN
jgi:transcriptional regulator with XRE-family HTH domain